MIEVTISKDSQDVCHGIELCGHAEYGEHGQDIVCAAASALVLNMANSVGAFTEDSYEGTMDEETGEFSFHFTSEISLESQLLMDSLILGLENIQREYGEEYILIRLEEV